MEPLAESSEAEMIAVWLRNEMSSTRFSGRISRIAGELGIDASALTEPDVTDARGNADRRSVLEVYRGYGTPDRGTPDRDLLAGFPTGAVKWERGSLDPSELLSVRYINWDYWLKLSGGTRRPVDAARLIANDHSVYGIANDGFLHLAAEVRSGRRFPPVILVTTGRPGDHVVVVEGHSRLTGYALAADSLPAETEALMGTHVTIGEWWAF